MISLFPLIIKLNRKLIQLDDENGLLWSSRAPLKKILLRKIAARSGFLLLTFREMLILFCAYEANPLLSGVGHRDQSQLTQIVHI